MAPACSVLTAEKSQWRECSGEYAIFQSLTNEASAVAARIFPLTAIAQV